MVKENRMLADIFGPDLLIVAIVLVVLLFGGAAIPKLARNLGSAKNQFEKGMEEGKKESANGTSVNGTSVNGTSTASDSPNPAQEKSSGS
jgi:sec-independent protein translocase protein TatA